MSSTTFSGPVRSQNGFEVVSVNSSTGAVTTTATLGATSSITTLSVSGTATLGAVVGGVQSLSGAGAVNLTTLVTSLTTTGSAQALTLADGTVGQIKVIVHVVDGGSAVLTPTTGLGFTTMTFTSAGDSITLVYTAAGWAIIGNRGGTIA